METGVEDSVKNSVELSAWGWFHIMLVLTYHSPHTGGRKGVAALARLLTSWLPPQHSRAWRYIPRALALALHKMEKSATASGGELGSDEDWDDLEGGKGSGGAGGMMLDEQQSLGGGGVGSLSAAGGIIVAGSDGLHGTAAGLGGGGGGIGGPMHSYHPRQSGAGGGL